MAITARSLPSAIAASTRRRWAMSRLPWWMAMGSVSALIFHSAWNISSPWARVLTNTMVIWWAAMRSSTTGAALRPMCPDQGRRASGSRMASVGGVPCGCSISRGVVPAPT